MSLTCAQPTAVTPVAPRTANAPSPLTQDICLRCSKRIHSQPFVISKGGEVCCGTACDRTTHQKCSYCVRSRHPCEPVRFGMPFFFILLTAPGPCRFFRYCQSIVTAAGGPKPYTRCISPRFSLEFSLLTIVAWTAYRRSPCPGC